MGTIRNWLVEKLNPAQVNIAERESSATRSNRLPMSTKRAYEEMAIFNRGVNMLIDSAAEVDFDVNNSRGFTSYGSGIKGKTLKKLLNQRPNMFMDSSTFWRLVYADLILEGWAFIHYDEKEQSLYHVPAATMEVFADKKYYINKFVSDGRVTFAPNEIIFIKDNSFHVGGVSQISGYSRIMAALKPVLRKEKLEHFKEKFFDNGTIIGITIETDQNLSARAKERKREEIRLDHNPRNGKSNVLILDGGAKAKSMQSTSLNDLGIDEDMKRFEKEIFTTMGIPSVLIEGGNNANIRPNLELFYYMTVLPLAEKVEKALEFFFAFDIKLDVTDILALSPDKDAQSKALGSKVNNGIITGDEAREELRLAPMGTPEMTEIRIPQNVAGSNTGVAGQEGGAPNKENTDED